MKLAYQSSRRRYLTLGLTAILAVLLAACATQKPELRVSPFYRFTFEGEEYRIRSIKAPSQDDSFNELVGPGLLAIDYNQDQYVDRVRQGDMTLQEAQNIYTHGLNILRAEHKLAEKSMTEYTYEYRTPEFMCEIATIMPTGAPAFNKVKITLNPKLIVDQSIFVDYNADGKLDKALRGNMSLQDAQARYDEAIKFGLRKKRLNRDDGTILAREAKV